MSIELKIHEMIMEHATPIVTALELLQHQVENFEPAKPEVTTVEINLTNFNGVMSKIEGAHPLAPVVLMCIAQDKPEDRNVYVYGPSGTGKTHLCMEIAEGLKTDLYVSGSAISKYDFFGFKLPSGEVVETSFMKAWTTGGIWLADEVDRSDPKALAALNAALANGVADFSHCGLGLVKRHADCIIIATGNTAMNGQDARYSAASKQDAAFRDRFIFCHLELDEAFELTITPNPDWTKHVQAIRAAVKALGGKVDVMATMRASIQGASLLAAGMTYEQACEAVIYKGCSDEVKSLINQKLK